MYHLWADAQPSQKQKIQQYALIQGGSQNKYTWINNLDQYYKSKRKSLLVQAGLIQVETANSVLIWQV